MKVTIAYLPGEEQKAGNIKALIKDVLAGVKVRESDRHAPYMHVYLTTKKLEKPWGSNEIP